MPEVTLANEADSRSRIMGAARRVFAERGFDGATVREITDAAGVNTAAVNYYFRSKEELIRSVFEEGLKPIIAARLGALEECVRLSGDRPPTLEALSEALVRPLVELSSGEYRDVMVLLMHTRTVTKKTTAAIVVEQFTPVHERFVNVLETVLPHLSRPEIALRYDCARGATLQTLVDLAPAAALVSGVDADERENREILVRRLVAFVCAGFRAPPA
jgi:AcrR family transcriptional regulator